MKKIIFSSILFLSSLGLMAQDGIFALTYNMGIPAGGSNDNTGQGSYDYISKFSFRGFGIDGRGFVSDNVSLGGTFSWNVFYEEVEDGSYEFGNQTISGKFYKYVNAYPINFTAHYYFNDYDAPIRWHAGLGVGTTKINMETEFGAYQISHNEWHFNMTPDVGMLIPMSYRTNVFFSARYNYAFKNDGIDFGYFGFNIGFAWY